MERFAILLLVFAAGLCLVVIACDDLEDDLDLPGDLGSKNDCEKGYEDNPNGICVSYLEFAEEMCDGDGDSATDTDEEILDRDKLLSCSPEGDGDGDCQRCCWERDEGCSKLHNCREACGA